MMHIPANAISLNRHSELAEESPREALGRECGRFVICYKNRNVAALSLRFARGLFTSLRVTTFHVVDIRVTRMEG
jgi:hypothetical protein